MDNQQPEIKEKAKKRRPLYKRWWFWVILGVLTVVVLGIAAGGDEDDPSTGGTTAIIEGGGTTSIQYSDPKDSKPTYKIGDTVQVGDFSFTVTKVENTNRVGNQYIGDDTENNFAIITVKVTNTGTKELTLTSSSFSLFNGKNKYEPHSSGAYLDSGFYVLKEIGAGLSETIRILYETPTEPTEDWYIEFSQSYHSEKVYLK